MLICAGTVCLGVMTYYGIHLISDFSDYKKGVDTYNQLANEALKQPPFAMTSPALLPSGSPEPVEQEPLPSDFVEETPEVTKKPEPNYINEPAPDYWPELDYDMLITANPEFSAWLICVGTNINYPVVQGTDNSYYLTHMFNSNYGKAGTPFIDVNNSPNFIDRNTIIYSHNMRNHSMFWTLTQYKYQWFYDSHQTMRLLTRDGNYIIELFAGHVSLPGRDNSWQIDFSSDEEFSEWLQIHIGMSTFVSNGVEVTAQDKIVTLSTCSYETDNARYVVYGKLTAI
jgi:sortase B